MGAASDAISEDLKKAIATKLEENYELDPLTARSIVDDVIALLGPISRPPNHAPQ